MTASKLLMASAPSGPFLVTTLYTGNSTNFREFDVGHRTSLVVNKMRNPPASQPWCVTDVVRGVGKPLRFNQQLNETDSPNTIREFTSNGFKTGTANLTNESPYNYVAYSFTTNNPTITTNTDGTITSTINAGKANGFSICTYTGNGVNNATYGHGLDTAPELVITKRRDVADNWIVTGTQLLGYYYLLDLADGASYGNIPQPTSSVVTLNTRGEWNTNNATYVSYCFHSVAGKSKIGSYTGNGSSNGPTVTLDFEPAFVLIKAPFSAPWLVYDNKRDTTNTRTTVLELDDDDAERTFGGVDFNSSSFQIKSSATDINNNNSTYLYFAIAEES